MKGTNAEARAFYSFLDAIKSKVYLAERELMCKSFNISLLEGYRIMEPLAKKAIAEAMKRK